MNLIRNAIDAVSSPGTASREIHVQTLASGDREAVVIVSDTGPGFDPETEARLFEPFFSTKHSGMGMGLAICRSIVETHGGSMYARRLPHGGAEFRILLPLSSGPAIHPAEIPDRSSGKLQSFAPTQTATSLANSE
jgi:signal transduction histidine kinase